MVADADGDVDAALRAAFPDRTVTDWAEAGPSWNEANLTVRVDFADHDPAYLKLAVDGEGSRIGRERAVLEYVATERDVRVPDVLACDTDRDVPYLATAALAGEPLWVPWDGGDAEQRRRLCRRVGRTLAAVHEGRFETHGHITGGGAGGLDLEAGSWTDVLVDTVEEMRSLASTDRFDEHFDRVVDAVEANRDLVDDAPATLLHGDPAQPNCLHDDSVGLVDWERAHVGDPARDLYRARDQQIDPVRGSGDPDLVAALEAGYRERAGVLPAGYEERRPVYRAVRLLGVSGAFEKYADYADAPSDELEDWLREEMDRRLAAL